eukprot:7379499-Prymnesium_polylepis.1
MGLGLAWWWGSSHRLSATVGVHQGDTFTLEQHEKVDAVQIELASHSQHIAPELLCGQRVEQVAECPRAHDHIVSWSARKRLLDCLCEMHALLYVLRPPGYPRQCRAAVESNVSIPTCLKQATSKVPSSRGCAVSARISEESPSPVTPWR